jgi:glycosyltransferase involved in cell wall biosynthesis
MIDPTNPDYSNTPVSPRRPRFDYCPGELRAPPYVTIVTPFYNTGAVFHETASSVLQQSFQQWEWLIVNDGSTDPAALAILEVYRHSNPRIHIIDHSTNKGLSAARNTGFQTACAPYIVQLDSDDLLEPTAVEKWLWFLESYPEFAFIKGYTVGFGAQQYLWQRGFHDGKAFLDENLVAVTAMLRKAAHKAVGGYDEAMREGLEDWEFWLRCAQAQYWGTTMPEYLDWHRRRPTHGDRWQLWGDPERLHAFKVQLRQRYPRLWKGAFPQVQSRWPMPNDSVPDALPCDNRLTKRQPGLLMLVPWLTMGGADKFNLDVLEQLTRRGWRVTLVTTFAGDHSWLPAFARYTPDIFILHHFLRPVDYPRFLRYLIQSRQPDVVFMSNSELGYHLLPYLRAHFPQLPCVDFCHMEEEHWQNGGYPRLAVEYQELLTLNMVSSEYLKRWMAKQGADTQRLEVCYINIDTDQWRPDPARRALVRQELGLEETVPVVFYAGRVCAQKQPRVFAQTVLRLTQMGVHFVALVAGDGPDLAWLRSFLRRHRLGKRVRLLGAVTPQRMQNLMAAADVFFLPSQWEGIALTMYEAMACGLPVVGADVGGQRELVAPECGILVARSNEQTEAEQYAIVLAQLLRDPQYRQHLGQAGRARVETLFRLEQMAERMVCLFNQAVQLESTQPRRAPTLRLGQLYASRVVAYLRCFGTAEALWWKAVQHPQTSGSWRIRFYFALRRFLWSYYRAAVARDVRWIVSLKNRLKLLLLR